MAQPFGVGDVVGGRYRITHHVVTSADQDIVFQASDEVLDRDVSILLASRSNAKQVATSARELAMGSRDSDVQVLDLGLAEERTYLISSLQDPNALLDLVVPDTAPYVEPFFTDSLGSELFGQSRVMEPETYEDDDEYYAGLHAGSVSERSEDPARRFRRRRPAFLDKVSDSLNRRLNSGNDAAALAVAAGQAEQARATAAAYLRTDMEVTSADPAADAAEQFTGTRNVAAPGQTGPDASAASPSGSEQAAPVDLEEQAAGSSGGDETGTQLGGSDIAEAPRDTPAERLDGEEVVDDPPSSPVEDFDLPAAPETHARLPGPQRSSRLSDAVSFTGLIRPVPSVEDKATLQDRDSPDPASAASKASVSTVPQAAALSTAGASSSDGATQLPAEEPADPDFRDEKPSVGRWVTAAALAVLLVIAAILMFLNLREGETVDPAAEEDQTQDDGTDEAPGEGDQEEGAEDAPAAADGPAPEIANITRVVPDSPDLIADRDDQLSNLIDGDLATTWVTLSFATPDFGGFSSGVGLVAELDEPAEVSAVTITQEGESSGGSFEILVNDSASLEGAEQVGSGTLNWNETTVEVETDGETAYLIINITALPSQDPPAVEGLPYSTEISEISVD